MAAVTTLEKPWNGSSIRGGIHSAGELREAGSKQAVLRLKAQYPNTCVVILYHLEAALQGG